MCAKHIEDHKVGNEGGHVQQFELKKAFGGVNYQIHQKAVMMFHQPFIDRATAYANQRSQLPQTESSVSKKSIMAKSLAILRLATLTRLVEQIKIPQLAMHTFAQQDPSLETDGHN